MPDARAPDEDSSCYCVFLYCYPDPYYVTVTAPFLLLPPHTPSLPSVSRLRFSRVLLVACSCRYSVVDVNAPVRGLVNLAYDLGSCSMTSMRDMYRSSNSRSRLHEVQHTHVRVEDGDIMTGLASFVQPCLHSGHARGASQGCASSPTSPAESSSPSPSNRYPSPARP